MSKARKKFLFLSDSDRESAKSRLVAAGVPYIKKRLESRASNWETIVGIFETDPPLGVLVKLTNYTMGLLLAPNYAEVAAALLTKISQSSHIVFVHETFFKPDDIPEFSEEDEDEDLWFGSPQVLFGSLPEEQRAQVSQLFKSYGLNVVPYRRNFELSLLAGDFVESHQSNLIFRFYVPSGKIYAEQTVELLTLFRDYLSRSLGLQVKQSTHGTSNGTVYEFFGDGQLSQDDVAEKFDDFTNVMDLCLANPSEAEQLLIRQGADAGAVGRLVTDYSKKLRRLTNDIKQDRERKVLDIRHRLESDLIEVADQADLQAIADLVEQVVTKNAGFSDVMGIGTSIGRKDAISSVTVNVRPQFINHVKGIVSQEMYGDQHVGPETAELLELIRQGDFSNRAELQSAVYELEDDATSPQKRLRAGRLLQTFLNKFGAGVVDAGFGVLQTYIEGKLGIK